MTVIHVRGGSDFQSHLRNAGGKLVVVDFSATWYVFYLFVLCFLFFIYFFSCVLYWIFPDTKITKCVIGVDHVK